MRIVIHNFGPIKEADIETKRYTVFIGQTSTGKSVAAKLISIANDSDFFMLEEGDFKGFVGFLAQYGIDFPFHDEEAAVVQGGEGRDAEDVSDGVPASLCRFTGLVEIAFGGLSFTIEALQA